MTGEFTIKQLAEGGYICAGCHVNFADGQGLGIMWFCSRQCAFEHGGSAHSVIMRRQCPHCDRRFKTPDGLVGHIRTKHPRENKEMTTLKTERNRT